MTGFNTKAATVAPAAASHNVTRHTETVPHMTGFNVEMEGIPSC